MKKNLLAVCFVCFAVLSSVNVNAGDIVQPSRDSKSLLGKMVMLHGHSSSDTFTCRITGVSEYLSQMGRFVTISVVGLNYYGAEIKTISYAVTTDVERWKIEDGDRTQKITVTSIE